MKSFLFILLFVSFSFSLPLFAKKNAKHSTKPKPAPTLKQKQEVTKEIEIETPKESKKLPPPPTCTLIGPKEPLPPGGGEVILKVESQGAAQAVTAMKVNVTETTTISTSVEGPGGIGKCSVKIEVTPLPDLSGIE